MEILSFLSQTQQPWSNKKGLKCEAALHALHSVLGQEPRTCGCLVKCNFSLLPWMWVTGSIERICYILFFCFVALLSCSFCCQGGLLTQPLCLTCQSMLILQEGKNKASQVKFRNIWWSAVSEVWDKMFTWNEKSELLVVQSRSDTIVIKSFVFAKTELLGNRGSV